MSLRQLSFTPPGIGQHTPDGAFKDWVQLFSPGTRDSNGRTSDPVLFGSCWAAIRALTVQEQFRQQQIAQIVTQLVTIKYQVGVTANMTVWTADGRKFLVKNIEDPYNSQVELRMYCDEVGQNAGQ